MNFEEFREKCMVTAIKNDKCFNLLYASNALCGEAGEFANFVKKYYRDGTALSDEMKSELFDMLWYICYILDVQDWSFDEIIRLGFEKIKERHGVDLLEKTT